MEIQSSNNHLDLDLYEKIKEDVITKYPDYNIYHIKSIIDEKYKKIGGKFRNDKHIDTMKSYVNDLLTKKYDITPTITSVDMIKKHGQKKFIALQLCKEVDPKGNIDWINGRFMESC
tara:strand:- start:3327 stop:3677 length:351 start_codon:yes stop_codon:yes gene_type:complete